MDAVAGRGKIVVCAVSQKFVRGMWPMVVGRIRRAYEAVDNVMPPDLLERLVGGKAVLWIAVDGRDEICAAVVTEARITHRGTECCWVAAEGIDIGSDLVPTVSEFQRVVEEYARENRCARIVLEGRSGWRKFFPDYQLTLVTLEKDLSHAGR